METRQKVLADLTEEEAEQLLHDWTFLARPTQLPPVGVWQTWLVLAGRGFGKTRLGAEWARAQVKSGRGRLHLIAPTASDARDTMVEGESGLLAVCWSRDRTLAGDPLGRPQYEPSKRRLTWQNGAVATMFSAEEPERLRGPQAEVLWADELAAWKYLRETWDMAMFGLRLGDNPQTCITTTPKPLKLLKEIVEDEGTIVTRGSTYDNKVNLAATFVSQIIKKYEGTRLGRQELNAELLEEAEGALWSRNNIETCRHVGTLPALTRIVTAIDPAVTAKENSAETGIVSAGLGTDGIIYLLADDSGRFSPNDWASKALERYRVLRADRIIAEGNQGGDLVAHTIHTLDPTAPVKIVHASRGKVARAEPIAALYEQNRVRHVGTFTDLEDQMVNWEPLSGMASPDRLDAMVWALTELSAGITGQRVYEADLTTLEIDPFALPAHWPRSFAIALTPTQIAGLWGAWDGQNVCHVFGEYRAARQAMPVHASALKARGEWMRGVLASTGANAAETKAERAALSAVDVLVKADPATIDAGTAKTRQALDLGQVRVFSSLSGLKASYRAFYRDEDGRPTEADPMMDAFRALIASGQRRAGTQPTDIKAGRPSSTDKIAGY